MSLKSLAKISKTVEKYMIDEVSIVRPGAEAVTPVTLELTRSTTEVYSGKAMVSASGEVYDSNLGGMVTAETRFEVGIPAESDDILPNDEVVVLSSVNNPNMEGMRLIVIGQIDTTWLTHRRLTCIRKASGE